MVACAWKTATADGGGVLGEGLEAMWSRRGLIKRRRKEKRRRSKAKPMETVSVTVCPHLAMKICLPLLRTALLTEGSSSNWRTQGRRSSSLVIIMRSTLRNSGWRCIVLAGSGPSILIFCHRSPCLGKSRLQASSNIVMPRLNTSHALVNRPCKASGARYLTK